MELFNNDKHDVEKVIKYINAKCCFYYRNTRDNILNIDQKFRLIHYWLSCNDTAKMNKFEAPLKDLFRLEEKYKKQRS